MTVVYQNDHIKVEIEDSVIPWLKIFSKIKYKEFSECDITTKEQILSSLDIIEKEMLEYFKPEKINIASFGNYVPHVHFHIMSRFKNDPYFPEPMWGEKQRDTTPEFGELDIFYKNIKTLLEDKLD
jgi:diadenosine tetraphosphate (Ap4A) HIT family hydrolase